MAKLNELAEFVDSVLRLDMSTPVRGWNGIDIGPSNEQAQVLANRTRWLRERFEEIMAKYVTSVNGYDGEVKLTFNDVGADREGTASQAVKDHEAKQDPHPNYLNKERADVLYLKPSDGNTPGGFLQLDPSGKIPASAADAFKASYQVVNDEAERLALPKHDDLTICAQLNSNNQGNDQLYYLNAGDDPSVASNWIMGKSAVLQGVTSAYGRTGVIVSEVGDYNADQITETSDRVFLTPSERVLYASKQDRLESGVNIKKINGRSIVGPGEITLDANDIGGELAGTAAAAVLQHEKAKDPHPDYFNATRGDARYLQRTDGNQPKGFLQLDDSGKVPAGVIEVLKARYVVVDTEAERLALTLHSNLTICAQLNGPEDYDDRLYYLNADTDPSVAANWYEGQSAILQGVPSIFGRTGPVVAETGDYNADQITETSERTFVTPKERNTWEAKQERLSSGSNIKTFFGQPILGKGNLTPTPTQMGAAAEKHEHKVSDISDYTEKTQKLVFDSFEAGKGISIGFNPITGKSIITADGGASSGGGRKFITSLRNGSTAGQMHTFNIQEQSDYDLQAFALKEEAGAQNQLFSPENFADKSIYVTTPYIDYTGQLEIIKGGILKLVATDGLFAADAKTDAGSVTIDSRVGPPLVPIMTSNTTPTPIIITQSSAYNNTATWYGFSAFNGKPKDGSRWSGNGVPQWLGVQFPQGTEIASYSLTARIDIAYGGDPKDFVLQGSSDGKTWVDIDKRTGIVWKASEVKNFTLTEKVTYPYYRLYITAVQGDVSGLTTVSEMQYYNTAGKIVLQDKSGGVYIAKEGVLSKISDDVTEVDIQTQGFNYSGVLPASQLEGVGSLKAVSDLEIEVSYNIIPYAQLAIRQELSLGIEWQAIRRGNATQTVSGTGKVRFAVTRDNKNFYAVDSNGVWQLIPDVTLDSKGAQAILDNGMTFVVYNALTATQWNALYADVDGKPDYISVAYALGVSDVNSDAIVKTSTLYVDNTSSWKLQTPAECEIRWKKTSVSFKTVTAGNYRLAYQIP